ncbi:MAG: phosphate acyltransferase [Methylocystis sp.]
MSAHAPGSAVSSSRPTLRAHPSAGRANRARRPLSGLRTNPSAVERGAACADSRSPSPWISVPCPDVDQKKDIIQNAIILAHGIGILEPKVAILSAVETVRTKMPSTMEAAALAKMADRRQIVGGIVDGPLDLDIAVDAQSARTKGGDLPGRGRGRHFDRT